MSDLDLCYLSAGAALALFRKRKLSPVELLEAQIARADAVEPTINAFSFRYSDEARAQARKAEARYGKTDGRLRPLEGLTVAIKDEAMIAGKITTNASLLLQDFVPETTSPAIERIIKAGAIVHARTTTPEFSCAGFAHSRLWGVTRNPWNKRYSPGGSSGGSGAALAAGTATLASGSDIGGSIRIPASCSGVVGFKPPYGRNPEDPPFNLDFYCHVGPMARSVGDTALLQNVMCGPHPLDIASLKPKLELPGRFGGIKGWKIAYSLDLGYFQVDREVRRQTLAAVERLRDLGAVVEEVDLGWTLASEKAASDYLGLIFGASIAQYLDRADQLTSYARWFGELAQSVTGADFLKSLEVAGAMYATLGPLLERYRLLVCPTLALPAVRADFDHAKESLKINGKPVNPFAGWLMTYPFNMLSRCPVLSVPSGRARSGVPTGLQIVGRTYQDADVFRAAAAFEKQAPWYRDRENRPLAA